MPSESEGHSIRHFSLQTMFVWIGLSCFLLTVLVNHVGYIEEALIFSVGLYLIHQSLHTRFKHWRAGVVVGILVCLIGIASALFESPLRGIIRGNRELRELKEELLQNPPQFP